MEWENGAFGPLLVPNVITPDQYYDSRRDDSALRPVKRLMLALLEGCAAVLPEQLRREGRTAQASVLRS